MDLAHGLLPLASKAHQVPFLYLPCHPADIDTDIPSIHTHWIHLWRLHELCQTRHISTNWVCMVLHLTECRLQVDSLKMRCICAHSDECTVQVGWGAHSAVGAPSVSSRVTSMKKLVALSAGKRRLLLMSRLGRLTRMVSADRKAVWKA